MYVGDMSNGYIEQPVSNSAAAAAPPNQTGNTTLNFSFFFFPRGVSVSLCFVIALVSSPQVHSPFLLLQVFFFQFYLFEKREQV